MPSTSRLVDVAVALSAALVLAYATLIVQQVLLGLLVVVLVAVGWLLVRTDLDRRRRHVAGQWIAIAAVVVYGVVVAREGVLAAGVATAVYYVGHVTRPLPSERTGAGTAATPEDAADDAASDAVADEAGTDGDGPDDSGGDETGPADGDDAERDPAPDEATDAGAAGGDDADADADADVDR